MATVLISHDRVDGSVLNGATPAHTPLIEQAGRWTPAGDGRWTAPATGDVFRDVCHLDRTANLILQAGVDPDGAAVFLDIDDDDEGEDEAC